MRQHSKLSTLFSVLATLLAVPRAHADAVQGTQPYAGGIRSISVNGQLITTGGAYNTVLSCEGPDHQASNGESGLGLGFFTKPDGTLPACGRIPYAMKFTGTSPIKAELRIGPFPQPLAIVSMTLDLERSVFTKFRWNNGGAGWSEGCGYVENGDWLQVGGGRTEGRYDAIYSPCALTPTQQVGLARRDFAPGLELQAKGYIADVKRRFLVFDLLDADGKVVDARLVGYTKQLAFYNHPGAYTISAEVTPVSPEGRLPAGYSIVLREELRTMTPSQKLPCGRLVPGQNLPKGTVLDSCDGRSRLAHQDDGNVVLYRLPSLVPVWASHTYGERTSLLSMQSDGNLVLYGVDGRAVFQTGTHGYPGAALALQDDGNLVVYSPGRRAIWQSGTYE